MPHFSKRHHLQPTSLNSTPTTPTRLCISPHATSPGTAFVSRHSTSVTRTCCAFHRQLLYWTKGTNRVRSATRAPTNPPCDLPPIIPTTFITAWSRAVDRRLDWQSGIFKNRGQTCLSAWGESLISGVTVFRGRLLREAAESQRRPQEVVIITTAALVKARWTQNSRLGIC
jgi:hypothetical protein